MKIILLILVVALALHGSLALNETQVLRLQELNTAFDLVHKNFDHRINRATANTTSELKILQAQLISRLGFVTDEIRIKQGETEVAINETLSVVGLENECVIELQLALENAVEYAGYSINGLVGEVVFYINQIERDYFFPYIAALQRESNIIQWMVLAELHRENPVTHIDRLITRLDSDYFVILALYNSAIEQIPAEMIRLHEHTDEVKEFYFPQLNSIRDYFSFTADIIKESLSACSEVAPE